MSVAMHAITSGPASGFGARNSARTTLFVLVLVSASALPAHEGHAPLPTRGAQVDLKAGVITLSAEARDALGVDTAEVVQEASEERLLAYVTLETRWNQHAFVA